MPQRALMKFVLRVESRWLASGDTLRCGFLILADDAWCPDHTDNRGRLPRPLSCEVQPRAPQGGWGAAGVARTVSSAG
jgi:hypothetical protein